MMLIIGKEDEMETPAPRRYPGKEDAMEYESISQMKTDGWIDAADDGVNHYMVKDSQRLNVVTDETDSIVDIETDVSGWENPE